MMNRREKVAPREFARRDAERSALAVEEQSRFEEQSRSEYLTAEAYEALSPYARQLYHLSLTARSS